MHHGISIRPYETKDQEALLALLKLNVPLHFAESEIADFEFYLKHKTECYFILEAADEIIGAGGINFDPENKLAKISWDFISPTQQGKGIGKKLLEYRIDLLKEMMNIEKIIVRTSQTAYRFYEKSGFELQFIEKNYWAKGFDLYYMVYTL